MVHDAKSAATVAKVLDILRGCETILVEHQRHAESGAYGHGWKRTQLTHDLMSLRARLDRARWLMGGGEVTPPEAGGTVNEPPQQMSIYNS